MTAGVVEHARAVDRLDARAAGVRSSQPLDPSTWAAMRDDLHRARVNRNLAIGTGVSAAVVIGLGAAFFVLARGRTGSRLALAPWWLSSGAGLTASLRLP